MSNVVLESTCQSMLHQFVSELDLAERRKFKSILAGRVEDFFNQENNTLTFGPDATPEQFEQVCDVLKVLPTPIENLQPNGIIYRGFLDFVTPELVEALKQEAYQQKLIAFGHKDHYLSYHGPVAAGFSIDPHLVSFLENKVGPVRPTGIASYIFYDKDKNGIRCHVDTEVFAINMILMLRHNKPSSGSSSATVVYPAGKPVEYYRLEVGETLFMYGSRVVHGRTFIQPDEEVDIVTFGFNPIEEHSIDDCKSA